VFGGFVGDIFFGFNLGFPRRHGGRKDFVIGMNLGVLGVFVGDIFFAFNLGSTETRRSQRFL
ncbi:MAG: hypothetical protein HKN76_05650, partial [Saprospiraceae bacterium]|nr:hypothetical protein [Saprospiraceae bacterium]